MPVHNWTRVDAGIFHAFHLSWLGRLQDALNDGVLPHRYYALAEQHAGRAIADLFALKSGKPPNQCIAPCSIAVRHESGHRLVALLEIVSPANKDRAASVAEFATKVVNALDCGIYALVVDLLPPTRRDPDGMHSEIARRLEQGDHPYRLPADGPLTLASYHAASMIEMYIDHPSCGSALPEMPLFLVPDHCVSVPLETTYCEAYHSMPAFWRDILEGRSNG